MSRIFRTLVRRLARPVNPAEDVELFKRPKDARKVNRAWTDEEIGTVLHAAPAGTLRVAIGIGLFTGMREGDVVRVAKSKYDGKSFATRAHKNGRELWIPGKRCSDRTWFLR